MKTIHWTSRRRPDISDRRRHAQDRRICQRLSAILWSDDGRTREEIAELLGISTRQMQRTLGGSMKTAWFLMHRIREAMKDDGGAHKYLSKGQLFAFADSAVTIEKNTPPVTLYAYSELPDLKPAKNALPAKAATKPNDKDRRLQFTTNIANGVFDVLDTFRFTFPNALKTFDSTRIRFTDENFQDIDPKTYHYARDSTNKKFTLIFSWPMPR